MRRSADAATRMAAITEQPVEHQVLYHRDPAAAIADHARSMGAALIALAGAQRER